MEVKMRAQPKKAGAEKVPRSPASHRLGIKRVIRYVPVLAGRTITVGTAPWKEAMASSEKEERKFQAENTWMKAWNMGYGRDAHSAKVRRPSELFSKPQRIAGVLSKERP
jgi:hypothetical protein